MGTNFYVEAPPTPWGESQRIHVGKSSIGWRFCFEAQQLDETHLTTTADWRRFLDGMVAHGPCRLVTEYGEERDLDEFWGFVEAKKSMPRHGGQYEDDGNAFACYEFR